MNTTDPDKALMDSIAADLKESAEGSAAVMDFARSGQEGTFENPYFSKRREQSLSKIHDVLRGRLVERLSTKPEVIQDRLSAWAKDARAESLSEYLTGIFPKLSELDYKDLENEVVAAFKAIGSEEAPCFATWIVSKGEPSDPNTCVTAWMEARRGDALPPIPEGKIFRGGPLAWDGNDMLHLPAVDGLLELFQCLRWEMLAGSLWNPEWLHLLADWWLNDKIKEEEKRLEEDKAALALDGRHRTMVNENEYGQSPKEISGMAWTTGPGIKTELDCGGKTGIFIMPPGARLLKDAHKGKPHQDSLPIAVPGPLDDAPLPLMMAHGDKEMMPAMSAKIMLLAFNALMQEGSKRILRTTPRLLTKELNPDARVVASHYDSVMKGIRMLSSLSVVLPHCGWKAFRILVSEIPIRDLRPSEYDDDLNLMINPFLMEAMTKGNAGTSYAGHFLYNLTGVMKLPVSKPGLLRHYLRAVSTWNAARNRAGRIELNEKTETWALIANTMTTAAVEGSRQRKSESIAHTIKDLKELADREMVVAKRIDKERVILTMPADLEEAWQRFTKIRNPRK
jgi:hypothetical protein